MHNKPTLSFYTNIPTPYQLAFFDELAKRFDLTVIYYSATESNREWRFDLKSGYKVIVLKNNSIAKSVQRKVVDFHFSWQIFRVVWNDKNEFVIVGGAYWIPNASMALLLSRIKSKKVAYFTEPLFVVNSKLKYAVKWLMLRILSLSCHAIFCIGKKAAQSLDSYGVKVPKFIIPYNINSTAFIQTDNIKKQPLAAKYKRNGELIILSSGSLIERKGMDILIKAVKQINNPSIRLIIIGDGPLRQELEILIDNDERITLAGHQTPEDIPCYFAIADVFAFASRYDGWAVVINEAIAANLPVISSDHVGAAVELITSPELGILCKSDSVEEFKQAIQLLTEDVAKRTEIKEASRALIPKISSDFYANYVYDIFVNKLT